MGDDTAGGKPPEYWLLAFRDIVEGALDRHEKHMCNLIKTASPELVEISKSQHEDTISKIDELVQGLNSAMRLMYIAMAVLGSVGVVVLGAMLFVIFFLSK